MSLFRCGQCVGGITGIQPNSTSNACDECIQNGVVDNSNCTDCNGTVNGRWDWNVCDMCQERSRPVEGKVSQPYISIIDKVDLPQFDCTNIIK